MCNLCIERRFFSRTNVQFSIRKWFLALGNYSSEQSQLPAPWKHFDPKLLSWVSHYTLVTIEWMQTFTFELFLFSVQEDIDTHVDLFQVFRLFNRIMFYVKVWKFEESIFILKFIWFDMLEQLWCLKCVAIHITT